MTTEDRVVEQADKEVVEEPFDEALEPVYEDIEDEEVYQDDAPARAEPARFEVPEEFKDFELTPAERAQAEKEMRKLTVDEYVALSRYAEAVSDQINLGEAAGICWGNLYTKQGIEVSVTGRGVTVEKAIDNFASGVIHGIKRYGFAARPPQSSAAQQGPALAPAPPPANAPAAPAAHAASTSAPAPVPADGQRFKCVMIEVIPKPDSKAQVKFYGNTYRQPVDEYPTLSHWGTHDQLVALLQPVGQWTPEHFAVAQKYNVNFVVEWKNSTKTNREGKPYKDLSAVFPA